MKVGDIVTIKPEWQESNEKNLTYTIVEWNTRQGEEPRGYIVCNELLLNWFERPQELVRERMIEIKTN
jgi:hypothetical protein